MGEVFVAEQQQIRTKVAIKMLLAKISENHEIVQRFLDETRAWSSGLGLALPDPASLGLDFVTPGARPAGDSKHGARA